MSEASPPTVRELFEKLGVSNPGSDLDEAVRWALLEILDRRRADELADRWAEEQQRSADEAEAKANESFLQQFTDARYSE